MNSNYNKAEEELLLFESLKRKKYRPMFDRSKSSILVGVDDDEKTHEIIVGPVLSRGKDLPSGKNFADYIDYCGRIDLVHFLATTSDTFQQCGLLYSVRPPGG